MLRSPLTNIRIGTCRQGAIPRRPRGHPSMLPSPSVNAVSDSSVSRGVAGSSPRSVPERAGPPTRRSRRRCPIARRRQLDEAPAPHRPLDCHITGGSRHHRDGHCRQLRQHGRIRSLQPKEDGPMPEIDPVGDQSESATSGRQANTPASRLGPTAAQITAAAPNRHHGIRPSEGRATPASRTANPTRPNAPRRVAPTSPGLLGRARQRAARRASHRSKGLQPRHRTVVGPREIPEVVDHTWSR